MVRALVTGGGGFLGKAILKRLLAEGIAVRSFARGDYPDLRELGAETVRGDLANPDAVHEAAAGCDAVFHVAAKAGQWGPYEAYYAANVTGTENVIAACRAHGIRKLVYTSTPSVATSREPIEGADESIGYPDRYDSHYAETKAIAEKAVLAANDADLATVALRPRLVLGPGDRLLFPRLVERARAGTPLKIGQPPILIDVTYIDNAVDAHMLAYEKLEPGAAIAGKAYFISNGEPIDVGEILERYVGVAGVQLSDRRIPRGLALAAGALFETVWRVLGREDDPRLTRFLVLGLSTPNWFDISAAREELGYEPRISIDEGLRRMRQWYEETYDGD